MMSCSGAFIVNLEKISQIVQVFGHCKEQVKTGCAWSSWIFDTLVRVYFSGNYPLRANIYICEK